VAGVNATAGRRAASTNRGGFASKTASHAKRDAAASHSHAASPRHIPAQSASEILRLLSWAVVGLLAAVLLQRLYSRRLRGLVRYHPPLPSKAL
jgi:hypothetical protein